MKSAFPIILILEIQTNQLILECYIQTIKWCKFFKMKFYSDKEWANTFNRNIL